LGGFVSVGQQFRLGPTSPTTSREVDLLHRGGRVGTWISRALRPGGFSMCGDSDIGGLVHGFMNIIALAAPFPM
jgi:hypothetical protein